MNADVEDRIEDDTMGEVRVPKHALYAAQTQRAVENFPISGAGTRACADRGACTHQAPSIVTPLNRLIGYEAAAKIAKHSVAQGITVREAVIDLGYVERGELSEADLDKALDLLSMTHPGVAK